jgi:hypothetical protein
MTMSEEHICFWMLGFHVNRHGSWFQQKISWRFCSKRTTSFVHMNTIVSTWRHVKAFLNPYNLMGDYLSPGPLHVCGGEPFRQRRPVHQVHRHRCNHGLQRHTYPSSRSCRNETSRRPLPTSIQMPPKTMDQPKTRGIVVHITTDDLAPSFVVLCAPHAAKIPNYSTTFARNSCRVCGRNDTETCYFSIKVVICTNYKDYYNLLS